MNDTDLNETAAELTGRLHTAGVHAEPGLGGSVIIYASDEQAAVFLAALGHPVPDGDPAVTLRQQFLAAAAEIRAVYADTNGPIGSGGRQRIREAYALLYLLGSHIPDTLPGSPLTWGAMDDKDVAKALRSAEQGLASPQVTLDLIRELRRLRAELHAMGGPFGVTDEDLRSMIAEGFATAWRKGTDIPESVVIMKLIRDMDSEEWSRVISFVVDPLIRVLRKADGRPQPAPEKGSVRVLVLEACPDCGSEQLGPAADGCVHPFHRTGDGVVLTSETGETRA